MTAMPAPEPIVEVFIETVWNEDARPQRDQRAELLSSQVEQSGV